MRLPQLIPLEKRYSMIEIHHLNESRSRRITWMLEELGQDYKIISYQRDPKTRLAPPELKAILYSWPNSSSIQVMRRERDSFK